MFWLLVDFIDVIEGETIAIMVVNKPYYFTVNKKRIILKKCVLKADKAQKNV